MNTRSFMLAIVLVIIVFIFAVGTMAFYSSNPDQEKTTTYEKQIIINKYDSQPTQLYNIPTNTEKCDTEVTHYYNGKPVTECKKDVNYITQNQDITQVNVHVSAGYGGYYYPRYNYPYYKRPYHYPSCHKYHCPTYNARYY